jgi:MFS transporter, DHA1 family, inner membrane transport protein
MSALRTRRAALRRGGEPNPERQLVSLIRLVLLFESALYSAVSPVLPHYAHTLHASKPAIGVLAAAYPAGLIPGAFLGFWVATRGGVRRTTVVGLVGFGLAVIAFGFGTSIVTLDVLRAIQGMFCGLIWCGGLTWVIHVTPVQRRSRTLGGVLGAATFGTLFGPILGTVAVAVGTQPTFVVVGLVALGLAAVTLRHPEPPASSAVDPEHPIRDQLRGAWSSHPLRLGVWLVLLEAATFGAVNALLPLRLSHLGASGFAIGLTFVLGSALSASLAPVIGHVTDRRGAYLPLIAGLVIGAPLMALLVVPHSAWALAALMVITFGGPLTFSMIPAASLMTESAEAVGVTLVLATTLFNLAYALGETLGAPISASVAQATTDFVPLLAIALLMLVTAAWALTHRRRPVPQAATVSTARSTPSSNAAAASDISTYRSGVCSESPSTMCTASPSVSADNRSATPAGSETDHSPLSHP